ncbi:DUF397 domain-containing protein [Streptomyces niveus]|uniref:DUF397 domain-containing protein n=1 Tax=Streptomyces niveus TaxID=193462 RepID=UPI003CFE7BC2
MDTPPAVRATISVSPSYAWLPYATPQALTPTESSALIVELMGEEQLQQWRRVRRGRPTPTHVHIRDPKQPSGPTLTVGPDAWAGFVGLVAN